MRLSKTLLSLMVIPLLQWAAPADAAGGAAERAAKPGAMRLADTYPVIVTDKLTACRDFYVRRLGFEIAFEASWFVYLSSGTNGIAFMSTDHPSQPPGPEKFEGRGAFLTLQVDDARAAFAQLKAAGTPIAYPLRDEPWGQRRFAIVDPAGLWLDVVQQTQPAAGYWDKYPPR